MKITYRIKKQDYLNSVNLKQSINRQGLLLMRLIGLPGHFQRRLLKRGRP
jgi:hypothetical protein